jgi:hypothetical protein
MAAEAVARTSATESAIFELVDMAVSPLYRDQGQPSLTICKKTSQEMLALSIQQRSRFGQPEVLRRAHARDGYASYQRTWLHGHGAADDLALMEDCVNVRALLPVEEDGRRRTRLIDSPGERRCRLCHDDPTMDQLQTELLVSHRVLVGFGRDPSGSVGRP